MKVAVVEKMENPGGTCLNIGCIPSKALLASSELFSQVKNHLGDHGISVAEPLLDLKKMMLRKAKVVEQLTKGVSLLLKSNGVTLNTGRGNLISPTQIEITDKAGKTKQLFTKNTILATGSVPAPLSFLPFDGKRIVSSTEALSFESVPHKLIIVGAGAIGLELGSVWSRLGAEVTVIELMQQILPGMDTGVSNYLGRVLKRQGMKIHLSTKVMEYQNSKNFIKIFAEDSSGERLEFRANKVLVAAGRVPYHEGLDVRKLGIEVEKKTGFISVDESYKTNVKGVYAIGDLIGGPMLAHKAAEEGIACVENIAGLAGHVNYRAVPAIIYTSPEAASVGKTEEQLKEEARAYNSGSFPYRANGRALTAGITDGFVKILADKKTDEVLGVHIVGPFASDIIGEGIMAIEFGGSAEDIARTVHAHPTLSEAMKEAALAVDKRAIHFSS
jgi:dihydrolipoamide dehydrogenase